MKTQVQKQNSNKKVSAAQFRMLNPVVLHVQFQQEGELGYKSCDLLLGEGGMQEFLKAMAEGQVPTLPQVHPASALKLYSEKRSTESWAGSGERYAPLERVEQDGVVVWSVGAVPEQFSIPESMLLAAGQVGSGCKNVSFA